jgi:hypothetical protein
MSTVFAGGSRSISRCQRSRNNLGHLRTHHIRAPRDAAGFQFYAAKDRAMADTAELGLMIRDGKSPGTILNILRLLRSGKMAVLIQAAQTSHTFKSIQHWHNFIATCSPQIVRSLRSGENLILMCWCHGDLIIAQIGRLLLFKCE